MVVPLNGHDPAMAMDGYSPDQITYHLELLREDGLIDSPGSQPMIGVSFRSLTSRGHDFLENIQNAAARIAGAAPRHPIDILSGGDTELDRLVRAASPPQASRHAASSREQQAAPVEAKSAELLTLKPGIWGMSIDLIDEKWRSSHST